MGDVNLDWLTNASEGLKDLCTDLNFTQLISAPTRPDPANLEKATFLDLVLTNTPHNFKSSGVLPLDFCDHCPIACIRDVRQEKLKPRFIVKRTFKQLVEQDFLYDLSFSDIFSTTAIPDPCIALNYVIKICNSIADKHAPFKKLRIKNRSNPWFSSDVADMLCIRYMCITHNI